MSWWPMSDMGSNATVTAAQYRRPVRLNEQTYLCPLSSWIIDGRVFECAEQRTVCVDRYEARRCKHIPNNGRPDRARRCGEPLGLHSPPPVEWGAARV